MPDAVITPPPPPLPQSQDRETTQEEQVPPPAFAAPAAQPTQYQPVNQQPLPPLRTSARKLMFLLGPGFSFGIFSPGDVNNYLEEKTSSYSMESGFSGMFLNLVPRFSFAFAPIQYVEIEAVGEFGWGPKIISVKGGDSKVYSFIRGSVGATVTGHIPLKNYKYALFGGAGFMYHWMAFEDYDANTPGARAVLGFRIYKKTFTPSILVIFDYARATDVSQATPFELNYTGVMIGANFHFRVFSR